MLGNSNALAEQQGDVTRGVDAVAGRERKLPAEQEDMRKRHGTGNLDGNEEPSKDDSTIDTFMGEGDDRSEPDGDGDSLESDEERFERDDGMYDEDGEGKSEEDEEGYNEFEEFEWLKVINMSIKASDAADSPQVGCCTAKLIDREQIRANFHRDMEEPSNDTATVGFGVFDRWGCLRPEYQNHPVKKGTGVWGPELNDGRFLLIETLSVKEEYQRKGYGRKLFQQVWEKAQILATQEDNERKAAEIKHHEKIWEDEPVGQKPKIDEEYLEKLDKIFSPEQKIPTGCDFVIIWAIALNTSALEAEQEKLSPAESETFYQKRQGEQEAFWKALGFRRIGSTPFFCLAKDPKHPSHLLDPQDDYIRPAALSTSARTEGQSFPLIDPPPDSKVFYQKKWNDSETKELLEARLQSYAPTDPAWLSTDRHGNNIMHILAVQEKVESLTWVLSMPFAATLHSMRNLQGETPLETLECQLESNRTWKQVMLAQVVMSDIFSGFTPSQVECLRLLKKLKTPSSVEKLRITFGCIGNQCVGGFLSPRILFALLCQAEINHDMLNDDLNSDHMSGVEWCEWREYMFEYLVPSVRTNLRTNKSLRQGFTNIFKYIAEALEAKRLPLTSIVLQYADGEWPPHVKNFLNRGGTVHGVLQKCFDRAMDEDIYLGSGDHQAAFKKDIDTLPTCRNDREFLFARRQLRRLEGLPDELCPGVGMEGLW